VIYAKNLKAEKKETITWLVFNRLNKSMNKTFIILSVLGLLSVLAFITFFVRNQSRHMPYSAKQDNSGTPVAVARANGLDSLTIILPCYTQKDNGTDAITLNGRESAAATLYAWTKVSGPAGGLIVNAAAPDTRVVKMAAGTYIFKLTITNDVSATASATVVVTVNPAAKPVIITVDTIGHPGTNEELQYNNQSNKICYIRAGTYRSFFGFNLSNVHFKVKYHTAGDQVVINSPSYYAFRFSEGYSSNITIDGSGVPGQPYGFKIIGPNVADAVISFHDSSRNRVIKNTEIQGGYASNTGGQGIGLDIYPHYPQPGNVDTTATNIRLSRQGGFSMGNDSIINCFIHGCVNEGIYEGPSHYGDKTINGYSGFFPEAQVDTFYCANTIIDSTGQSGMNVGAVAGLATITNNTINHFALKNQSGHTGGINVNGGSRTLIYGNKFWNELPYTSETQGIAAQGVGGSIFNNEFTGCQYAIILLRNTDKNCGLNVPDLYLFNNTIVNVQYGFYVFSANYTAGKIHWKNNIVAGSANNFGANGNDYSAMDTASNYYGTLAAVKFTNIATRDYSLAAGSPLAGTGIPLNTFFTDDINKVTRTASWSKGAHK
jgi:hypothetical protein